MTHKDGLLIYADSKFHEMNFYPAHLEGRSGRGDTCIGTYVAKRLSLAPREAAIWAAAVTSLKMENDDTAGLLARAGMMRRIAVS